MPCNLNFNQCNSGQQYPNPISNCLRNLIADLNRSENVIINPVIDTSFALSIITSQTVENQALVFSSLSFSRGSSITFSNGTYILPEGSYVISYSISGLLPASETFAFALFQNGNIISSSTTSTSGNVGDSANGGDSEVISIVGTPAQITLRNISGASTTLIGGNITVQRL
ncbi:MAG: hypothetical protein IJX25_00775 [Clostridia bacterium]|nr:hypothetical protein [Clostridia bacterium]